MVKKCAVCNISWKKGNCSRSFHKRVIVEILPNITKEIDDLNYINSDMNILNELEYNMPPLNLEFEEEPNTKPSAKSHTRTNKKRKNRPGPKPSNLPKKRERLCEICGEILLYNSNLNRHIRNHFKSSLIVCELCGKTLNIGSKKKHMDSHANLKPFQCKKCYKKFTSSSSLKVHNDVTHLKQKLFECYVCQATFTRKNSLKFHIDRHIERGECRKKIEEEVEDREVTIQIFMCDYCNRLFRTNNLLTKHCLNEHHEYRNKEISKFKADEL